MHLKPYCVNPVITKIEIVVCIVDVSMYAQRVMYIAREASGSTRYFLGILTQTSMFVTMIFLEPGGFHFRLPPETSTHVRWDRKCYMIAIKST